MPDQNSGRNILSKFGYVPNKGNSSGLLGNVFQQDESGRNRLNPRVTEGALAMFGLPGILGSMYMRSQRKAGEELTKGSDIIEGQFADLNAFYNTEYYRDFLDTAEARSAQSQLQSQLRDMLKAYDNNSISTGATPEARIAAKTEGQQRYSEGINQILGLATQNKANIRRDFTADRGLLTNQLMNIYNQRAASYQQVSQNIADTGTSLLNLAGSFAGGGGG